MLTTFFYSPSLNTNSLLINSLFKLLSFTHQLSFPTSLLHSPTLFPNFSPLTLSNMPIVLYDDHPSRCAHPETVATFPTWDVSTYARDCDVDSWSKLLIPNTSEPEYICDCPVVYDDVTHEPIWFGFHTAECWDRSAIWAYVGATPWCYYCLRPKHADCLDGECLDDDVEMCGRCGLYEHTGSKCDVPCDAGWLDDYPHTWPKNKFAWQYSDGDGWCGIVAESRHHDENVLDTLANIGSELPPQPDEPEECLGRGCQRGNCYWCKEAAEYWSFCATRECYYHNCGEPRVRRDGANVGGNGEIICSGCAEYKVESCISSSRISPIY